MRGTRFLGFFGVTFALAACSLTTSLNGFSGGPDDGSSPKPIEASAATEGGEPGEAGDASTDAPTTDPLAVGLVGFWRFEETAGGIVSDSSGRGNDGLLMNGAARVAGKVGRAISLDGVDDYAVIPANASLATTTTMSAAFWLYLTVSPDATSPRLISRVDAWNIKLNGGHPQLSGGGSKYAISAATLGPGVWHHVAVVFDRGAVVLYVDGTPTVNATDTYTGGEILDEGTQLLLGAYATTSDFTNGLLDEVRLYDRVLTAAEVTMLAR